MTDTQQPLDPPTPRKSGFRIVKWIFLILVVLIVGAFIAVYFSLNSIVRSQVQTQATNSLGVQTTLGSANVSLFGGKVGLNDLQISSPQGFSAPKMFVLNGTSVDVSYGELRKDPIHIDTIDIKSPRLVIEQSAGKLNFKTLMDQMPKTEQQPEPNKEPMKLIIDKLTVSNASVVIKPGEIPGISGAVSLPQEIDIPIPSIELNNVGTGEGNQNGAAIKDVVMQLITTMAAKAADSDKIPPELKALLNLNINDVASKMGEQFKKQLESKVGDITKKLPGNVGNVVNDAIKNPQDLTKNPGAALQQGLQGIMGGNSNQPTQPATQPERTGRQRK
jgi:uncharacterized protein involved in outer membrane biogenesis